MSPPAIHGLHHIKIPVSSLEASVAFYTSFMGGQHIVQFDHKDTSGAIYACIIRFNPQGSVDPPQHYAPSPPDGDFVLELRLDPDQAAGLKRFDLLTFAVSSEKEVSQWLEWAGKNGVKNSGKIRALIGHMLAMEDPDGMRVRVYSLEMPQGGMDPKLTRGDPEWL